MSEEKIDLWNNKPKSLKNTENPQANEKIQKEQNINSAQTIESLEKIQIQESSSIEIESQKVYGIYEPANFNFNLNMWSTTKADDLRSSLKRINKINLSKSSVEILEAILFSFAYPPQGMSENEFVNLKVDWLIQNDRTELIESFLKQMSNLIAKVKQFNT